MNLAIGPADTEGPWQLDVPDDLAALSTVALLELLDQVGPEVIRRKSHADEAAALRLRLFIALDDREVSYRALAKRATGISSTAILKALQRALGRTQPIV